MNDDVRRGLGFLAVGAIAAVVTAVLYAIKANLDEGAALRGPIEILAGLAVLAMVGAIVVGLFRLARGLLAA